MAYSRKSYIWFSALVRIAAFLIAVSAILVMVVSAWKIAVTLKTMSEKDDMNSIIPGGHEISDPGYSDSTGTTTTDSSASGITEGSEFDTPDTEKPGYFPGMSENTSKPGYSTYQIILLSCLAVAIFAGFIQLVSSLSVVCTCYKAISRPVKLWLITNSFILLILILCAFLPLAYHKEKDGSKSGAEFIEGIQSEYQALVKEELKWEQWNEIIGKTYTFVVLFNDALLLVFMVLVGICLKCGDYQYEAVA